MKKWGIIKCLDLIEDGIWRKKVSEEEGLMFDWIIDE